ncbi:MAG: motility associated factor glycosyltransferase family protein [Gracilibacteraceae bacterium]|nr:motility associated factor glycosyltransferase family protein [Gracilibacteraceae bacterium]
MLPNNEQLIKRKYKWIFDILNTVNESKAPGEIAVEKRPGREPTICFKNSGKMLYLHSRYNPREEAERIISRFEYISDYDHIVFFGFGLGYHVEYFTANFPDKTFSIFEPELDIFRMCLENRDISFLDRSNFDNFYFSVEASEKKLEKLLTGMNCNILVIPLPSYETAFPEDYRSFKKIFGQYFDNTSIIDNTKKNNEKLHTLNALKNFGFIMNSPSIFNRDNSFLKNKPAIIVSAGPSLEYEIENLRYIKENGLAYIFSAGSSINTLLENRVYPHACWSIEPNAHSRMVYEKMISNGIKSIPLIFGSTTASTVVESYPGKLYHFITAKDLVSRYYLGNSLSSGEIVGMASSVAVVTLLALHKLGASPIILVGQNLAYKDQRYYSDGIDYSFGSKKIDSAYFNSSYKVPCVDGGYVYTDDTLNCFRKDMESYIRDFGMTNVINTTQGGALIKGTSYMPLKELLQDSIKDNVVDPEWELKLCNSYNRKLIKKRSDALKPEMEKFYKSVNKLRALSDKVHDENKAALFYRIINEILENEFFHAFLYSMNVYECKLLVKDIKLKNGKGSDAFPVSLFDRFIDFVNACIKDIYVIMPLLAEIYKQVS